MTATHDAAAMPGPARPPQERAPDPAASPGVAAPGAAPAPAKAPDGGAVTLTRVFDLPPDDGSPRLPASLQVSIVTYRPDMRLLDR